MAIIPCLNPKCILLPICKSREKIYCNQLRVFLDNRYSNFRNNTITADTMKQTFAYMLSVLNEVQGVYFEED